MKTLRMLLCSLSGLTAVLSLHAATAPKPDDRTEIVFFEREKFTDVKDGLSDTPKGRDAILDQIKDYIIGQAKKYVAEDQKLTVTITDVDLAGDFEPERSPRLQDVRIIRDIYPPKINLTFKLTAADGNELKHGTRELTDVMFMNNLTFNSNDPLRYEKNLLDDWLRADFARVK
jgi:hypothetical protein